ncbi:unnamed protein product [Acanthoscelides obtectus]|uniref:Uncharacterized protein n=1 Tax=Acanthoscelides obtectus TaxID=200917 RepID=A0A9P0ML29_ACAOB|nr:unnamed protein product [Acanthoscelides obtectus]CAK1630870.1 hypothetical protein AOBTE_LOCUS6604 [Acanthoscelides obtectus]
MWPKGHFKKMQFGGPHYEIFLYNIITELM